jgi:hypothetical protein
VAHAVERLLCKHEALSSNSTSAQKKKEIYLQFGLLSIYYVSGTVVEAKDVTVRKTVPVLMEYIV